MIWLKYFEFGPRNVQLLPKRSGDFSVVAVGFEPPHYDGWQYSDWTDRRVVTFTGSLVEANHEFNRLVSFLTARYDDCIQHVLDGDI